MHGYSEAVKADVKRPDEPRRNRQERDLGISERAGMHVITLFKWRKTWRLQGRRLVQDTFSRQE